MYTPSQLSLHELCSSVHSRKKYLMYRIKVVCGLVIFLFLWQNTVTKATWERVILAYSTRRTRTHHGWNMTAWERHGRRSQKPKASISTEGTTEEIKRKWLEALISKHTSVDRPSARRPDLLSFLHSASNCEVSADMRAGAGHVSFKPPQSPFFVHSSINSQWTMRY